METSRIDFKGVLGDYDKEIHVIVHSYPDPDAISSALGIHHYLAALGYKVGNIYYSGEVSHPQNMAMLNILNLKMVDYDEHPFELGIKAILVDTSNIGPDSNQQSIDPKTVEIVAVVDHHRGKNPKCAKIDSREVGSCASIVWEYLNSVQYDFSTDEGSNLATSIVLGISTDTNFLTSENVTDLDFEAYKQVLNFINRQKFTQIMEYPLPVYLFELRQKAFLNENYKIEKSTLVSGLGVISPSKRDAIPIIAEEFIRMPGVTTSVVFAIIGDYISISIRSKNVTLDIDEFIKKVFGTGGGKRGSGGAKISLGFFYIENSESIIEEVWGITKKIIFSKIFSKDE